MDDKIEVIPSMTGIANRLGKEKMKELVIKKIADELKDKMKETYYVDDTKTINKDDIKIGELYRYYKREIYLVLGICEKMVMSGPNDLKKAIDINTNKTVYLLFVRNNDIMIHGEHLNEPLVVLRKFGEETLYVCNISEFLSEIDKDELPELLDRSRFIKLEKFKDTNLREGYTKVEFLQNFGNRQRDYNILEEYFHYKIHYFYKTNIKDIIYEEYDIEKSNQILKELYINNHLLIKFLKDHDEINIPGDIYCSIIVKNNKKFKLIIKSLGVYNDYQDYVEVKRVIYKVENKNGIKCEELTIKDYADNITEKYGITNYERFTKILKIKNINILVEKQIDIEDFPMYYLQDLLVYENIIKKYKI